MILAEKKKTHVASAQTIRVTGDRFAFARSKQREEKKLAGGIFPLIAFTFITLLAIYILFY